MFKKKVNTNNRFYYSSDKSLFDVKLLLVILVIFFSLSIGYSAFENDMMISDIASNIRLYSDIRVTSVNIDSSNNGGISNYEDYNVSLISSNIDLPNEDSSVIYRVSVTNFGSMDMGIFDITGLSNNLDMDIDGYSLKDKICNSNGECNLGITRDFYITIKYGVDDDGNSLYDSSNTNYDVRLDFDFREIYSISYENILDTEKLPVDVMDGSSLEIYFGENEVNYIDVYIDNELFDNYDINNGFMFIYDVFGDIRFVLPKEEVGRVILIYNEQQITNIAPYDTDNVIFSEITDIDGNVIRCNNGAIPSLIDGIVNVNNVSIDNTECKIFNTLKSSIDTSDNSVNNLLMINDENAIEEIDIDVDKKIRLDINGKVINANIVGETEETSIYIVNYGDLIIGDSVGMGLMKSNYYLIHNYGNLTINSGNYRKENVDSTVGAVVLAYDGNVIINDANLSTDKSYVVFTKGTDGAVVKVNNSTIKADATSGGALTNNGSNSIISVINSLVVNGANNGIYATTKNGSTYICGSTIKGTVSDLYSSNGRIFYTANSLFTSGDNIPVISATNDYYVVKNYLNSCSDEWYIIKDIDGNFVKYSNGNIAKVGDELQIESQISNNLVMDYNGGNAVEGNNVWTYTPWAADVVESVDAQRFTLLASNDIDNKYYNLALYYNPNFYLHNDTGTATNGNGILLSAASTNNAGKFRLRITSTGYYSFVTNHNTCIDIPAASKEIKTNLQNYSCNNTNAQSWKLNVFS